MIKKTEAFKTEDGTCHATLEAAQEHELCNLFQSSETPNQAGCIAFQIMKQKSIILTILTGQRGKDKHPRKKKNNPDLIAPRPG